MARTATKQDFETAIMLLSRGIPASRVSKLLGYATGTLYVWKKQATWEKHEEERIEGARIQRERAAEQKKDYTAAPAEDLAVEKSEIEASDTDLVLQRLDRIVELLEQVVAPVDQKNQKNSLAKQLFG